MRLLNWYFLILIPIVFFILFRKRKKEGIPYSSVAALRKAGVKKSYKHLIGRTLYALAMVLLIIALARPQLPASILPHNEEGVDIVMVLDVSGSMEAIDFEPNRLEVARETISDFVDQRSGDRVGFVVFAGSAYTRIPLTLDHDIVQQSLQEVSTNSVSEEGTAIGMAISVGINRLKDSDAASKIMILVTDGDNNAGAIDPMTAAKLAAEKDIKVYSIGVGTDVTEIPYNFFGQTRYHRYETGLNEELLQSIAEITGGRYYRALSEEGFEDVFHTIDGLEKTDFDQETFRTYDEWAFVFMKFGLLSLLLGLFFDRYYYIQIP